MRPEFEKIVKGWSPDKFEDLCSRIDEAMLWIRSNTPISMQEEAVLRVMISSRTVCVILKEQHG